MLELKNITKDYITGDNTVQALKGVSIRFRNSEFVSILGQSGCGKTTLLNIIGGLDQYTDGDLLINHISTKTYKDRDWDTYRNHSIGFVFQSYNLIPHQNVLANVELALTLSGVSKAERKRRATEALNKVGLGDQLHKKPNQMSGGQMQRVAIARALVNDPDILLADEPTGALDSKTSVQIMEILKEVSKDRLVIMVTHNPDLAEEYSTRIIRLSDGLILDDSNPYSIEKENEQKSTAEHQKARKTSMSFLTALSLSRNNLMTKKGRTFLTAFAGSIGIIGIALILSLSNGIQQYIDQVQKDTLTSYPIQIQKQTMDLGYLYSSMMEVRQNKEEHDSDHIYSNNMMGEMVNKMMTGVESNNLQKFKHYLETDGCELANIASGIQYSYHVTLNIYDENTENGINQVNPNTIMTEMMSYMMQSGKDGEDSSAPDYSMFMGANGFDSWYELYDSEEMLKSEYSVVSGRLPENKQEIVLIADSNNEITDIVLYGLGIKDKSTLSEVMKAMMNQEEIPNDVVKIDYDEIIGRKYRLVLPTDYYQYKEADGIYADQSHNMEYMKNLVNNGLELTIVGIIKPSEDRDTSSKSSVQGGIGYLPALTRYVIEESKQSDLIQAQTENKDIDVLNGLPFDTGENKIYTADEKASMISDYFDTLTDMEKASLYMKIASAPTEEDLIAMKDSFNAQYPDRASKIALIKEMIQNDELSMDMASEMAPEGTPQMDAETFLKYIDSISDEQLDGLVDQGIAMLVNDKYEKEMEALSGKLSSDEAASLFEEYVKNCSTEDLAGLYDNYMPASVSYSSYDKNMELFGYADLDDPSAISIYADSFENKNRISELIEEYNSNEINNGNEEDAIHYTDYVALMMSSVSNIINSISYVLIAFVAISLIVSSIMIGIITYISVLERTKEIGILRSIGASKHDISNVFNAETLLIGLVSGIIGIVVTLILNIPINAVIYHLSDISGVAKLPVLGAVILVLISMFLTLIAGLIPAKIAAKKDPVIALRTE